MVAMVWYGTVCDLTVNSNNCCNCPGPNSAYRMKERKKGHYPLSLIFTLFSHCAFVTVKNKRTEEANIQQRTNTSTVLCLDYLHPGTLFVSSC